MGKDDERTPEDTKRVMDAALKRALSTPPKPHKPTKTPKAKKQAGTR